MTNSAWPSAQLIHDMVRRESFVAVPYRDSLGNWTRGIGEKDGITANSSPVTYDQAVANLTTRLAVARNDARDIVGAEVFDALNDVRGDALTDIAYNTGRSGFASFYPMIQHIRNGDFDSAAFHLLVNVSGAIQSYERQVGARGVEIALRIATGQILTEQVFKQ